MCNVYTRLAVPDVPREVLEPGLVCVANWNQQWYRVQVSIDTNYIFLRVNFGRILPPFEFC